MSWDPTTTAAVVNPAAAGGRVGRMWGDLEPQLREHLGDIRFELTRGVGDGIRLAEAMVRDGARTVLSLGGDGTNSEVVNGIMATSPEPGAVRLGLLPSGTGGDFRRLLQHSKSAVEAAAALPTAAAQPIDIGSVDFFTDDGEPATRWFLNISAVGLSGTTVRIVNRGSKRLGGRLTFYIGALRGVLAYRAPVARVSVDGELVAEAAINNAIVCNGRYAGGGMLFAPDARLADGALDLVLFRAVPWWRTLLLSSAIYSGGHVRQPHVSVHTGQEIRVELVSGPPGLLDIDGESPGRAPATYRVHPGALQLLDLDPRFA